MTVRRTGERLVHIRSNVPLIGCAAVALAGIASIGAGCAEPLDSRRAGRTQFDPHDRARDRLEPETLTDEFGRPRPNLRGRLLRPEDL